MKILIVGSGGQLGIELCRRTWPAGSEIATADQPTLDIADRRQVAELVAGQRPGIVINAAAYTAVDRAESEPAAAWAGNCTGPANLAEACRSGGIPLIHVSTDYVFDGQKTGAYREDDPVNPIGVYGRSKEAGERAVRDIQPEHVILRTAWLYSAHRGNFVKTMVRAAERHPSLRVVADQRGCPTSAADLAGAIATITERIAAGQARWGTFHYAGAGAVTWHGFAEAIFELSAPWRGPPPRVAAITTAEYPTPARRPANSQLDCSSIGEAYGIAPRPWRESLSEILVELRQQIASVKDSEFPKSV